MLERLSGVEQVATATGQNQTPVMITGHASDLTLPPLEPGWQAVPVVENAMVLGPADAVDRALQRMAKDDPPGEMMRLAIARQANNEFWAIGFAGTASPASATTKVQGFSVEVSIHQPGSQ